MEKLKQKKEYVAKAQKTAKTVALLAVVIGVAVCAALFVAHARFAVWDKIVVCVVSLLAVAVCVTVWGVSVYYGNYAKYLSKLSTNIVTEKLTFLQTGDSVVKYGMRFSTFKFVSDNGNTLLLYALDTDNFVPQADEVYAVMHSGDFMADICEVTDDE